MKEQKNKVSKRTSLVCGIACLITAAMQGCRIVQLRQEGFTPNPVLVVCLILMLLMSGVWWYRFFSCDRKKPDEE